MEEHGSPPTVLRTYAVRPVHPVFPRPPQLTVLTHDRTEGRHWFFHLAGQCDGELHLLLVEDCVLENGGRCCLLARRAKRTGGTRWTAEENIPANDPNRISGCLAKTQAGRKQPSPRSFQFPGKSSSLPARDWPGSPATTYYVVTTGSMLLLHNGRSLHRRSSGRCQ